MRHSTLPALLCTLILAACASKQITPPEKGMIDAVQNYQTGSLTNNINVFMSAVCQQDAASAKALDLPVTAVGTYDASGIVFDV